MGTGGFRGRTQSCGLSPVPSGLGLSISLGFCALGKKTPEGTQSRVSNRQGSKNMFFRKSELSKETSPDPGGHKAYATLSLCFFVPPGDTSRKGVPFPQNPLSPRINLF